MYHLSDLTSPRSNRTDSLCLENRDGGIDTEPMTFHNVRMDYDDGIGSIDHIHHIPLPHYQKMANSRRALIREQQERL